MHAPASIAKRQAQAAAYERENQVKDIKSDQVADLAVTSGKIGSSAVLTDKINDAAVKTAKLADDAVTKDIKSDRVKDIKSDLVEKTTELRDMLLENTLLSESGFLFTEFLESLITYVEGS